MLEEFDYNGIRLIETRLGRQKFAFTYSPNLESHYANHMEVAEEMAANGIDWYNRDKMVLRKTVDSHDEDFSGITKPEELTDYDAMTSYLYSDKLKGVMDNMDGVINKASGKLNEPSKLVVGTKPTGIFSMAHAARGLIRLPEYYSPELKKVVDINRVDNEHGVFIYRPDPKNPADSYVVEQRQKGTTAIREANPL